MTEGQVCAGVPAFKDIAGVLRDADNKLKAEVYAKLGVRMTCHPQRRIISQGPCRS